MDLSELHRIVAERSPNWAAAGIGWEVIDGRPTDKPASWLILSRNAAVGQLTLWVSGEAEMEWGAPDHEGRRHYNVNSREALSGCVNDLEGAVGLRQTSP